MMRGDSVYIKHRDFILGAKENHLEEWGIGFIEIAPNEYGDSTIFIRNDFYGEDEPRWFFAIFVDPKFEAIFTTTRMVLTEKNRYIIMHGGKNLDELWQE